MAPTYSKLITKTNALAGAGAIVAIWYFTYLKKSKNLVAVRKTNNESLEEEIKYSISGKDEARTKTHVNKEFVGQLWKLIQIIVPGLTSKESGLFFLIAASLVSRSMCDLWLIDTGTKIESSIISMDKGLFKRRLITYFLTIPFISVVNNILKYSIGALKIQLRTNMTRRLYEDYLKNNTFYKMSNLDNRIANADQLLTTDVDKFCEGVTDLYCNTAKPLLDISIYVYKLSSTLGADTPALMLGYLFVSGLFLTHLRKPIAKFTAEEQRLEGEFRHVNSRLITHSEEVAFYNGNIREKATLLTSYGKLLNHLRKFLRFKVVMGVIDNLIAKYFASVVGFLVVSLPFLSESHEFAKAEQNTRSRFYYTYGRMLVKLAEAIGRLVLAGRDMSRLAGFTSRVTELRTVLSELNDGKYQRTMIAASSNLQPNSGKLIFKNNEIRFEKVPLVTPNGDVLISEISFQINSGMNVLVCGPNGAGKSSLFRILGELWPLFGGELTKPPPGKLFYIPQRPYMTLGCLRDQLTYPHSGAEASSRGASDEKLEEFLNMVQLEYLVEREGGLDAIADWLDILSGGEKQRIAMARLFYHRPQFAILDECTSAVSVDVEGSMYRYCKDMGITLLTVSHRKSLWQHHEYVLHLDGRGGYTFKPIKSCLEPFGS